MVGALCSRWQEPEPLGGVGLKAERTWHEEVGFAVFPRPAPRKEMAWGFYAGSWPLVELTSMKGFPRA